MNAIEVENLTKTFRTFERREGVRGSVQDLFFRDYKNVQAVDSISFQVKAGELIGYIGPNGAGKSTSIKMLTGILKPTAGKVEVLGYRPFEQRKDYTRHIGVVFGQRTQLWWDIAVVESFRLLAKIYGVTAQQYSTRLEELDGILGLKDLLKTPVRKLSLGQRMRCDLAASLLHKPQVLFLDEPTIGLDADAKDKIRAFLRRIHRDFGTTIILTTHDLKEIEELCRRVLILDHGKILFDGQLSAIKNLSGLERHILMDFSGPAPLEELRKLFDGQLKVVSEGERRILGSYDHTKLPTTEIVRSVMARFEVSDLTVSEPSIDDVIVRIYREGMFAPLS